MRTLLIEIRVNSILFAASIITLITSTVGAIMPLGMLYLVRFFVAYKADAPTEEHFFL